MLAAALLALTSIIAYVIDWAGFGLQAWPALGAAIALTIVAAVLRPRPIHPSAGDLVAWAGIVVFVVAMFLRMSWPSLVPPGRGPDLTHHLLLVDYIEQHGHLVHDRSLDGAMGEMAHYTPASHLLAVIARRACSAPMACARSFPLAVFCAALTAGFVFLIARRGGLPLPYAIVAVALLFLPAQYFFGAFTHDGFLAQTVSTLFAVATWWAHRAVGRSTGRCRRVRDRVVSCRDVPVLADLARPAAARVSRDAAPGGPVAARPRATAGDRDGAAAGGVPGAFVESLGLDGDRAHERRGAASVARQPRLACSRCSRSPASSSLQRSTRTRHDRAADRDRAAGRHAVRDRESPGRGHAVHGVQDDLSRDLSNGDPGRVAIASPERVWLARRREPGESKWRGRLARSRRCCSSSRCVPR